MSLQVLEFPKQLYSQVGIKKSRQDPFLSIVNASNAGTVPLMSPIPPAHPRRRAGSHLSHLCITIEAFGLREVK